MNRKLLAKELVRVARILTGMEFDSQDAMDKYLKEHPDADKSNHSVKKQEKEESSTSQKMTDHNIGLQKMLGDLAGDKRDHNLKTVKTELNQKYRDVNKKLDQMAKDSKNPKVKSTIDKVKKMFQEGREKGFSADHQSSIISHLHSAISEVKD